jgi:hypothetical protein
MRSPSRVAWFLVCLAFISAPLARAAEPGPAWGKRGMV